MRLENLVRGIVSSFILAMPSACTPSKGSIQDIKEHQVERKQKGFNFVSWKSEEYENLYSDNSLEEIKFLGSNFVALTPIHFQDGINSTLIYSLHGTTSTYSALRHAIEKAHRLGIKVMLKPHIELKDGNWRAMINFSSDYEYRMWFYNYQRLIVEYAKFAQDNSVEQICIGTELDGLTSRDGDWRRLIKEIRNVFKSNITYAATYSNARFVNWWNDLDFIGINAYFELTNKQDPSPLDLYNSWVVYLDDIKLLSDKYKKDIIFTEVGYRSLNGTNKAPWDFLSQGTTDLDEQKDAYGSIFWSFWDKSWFSGVYFWAWEANPKNTHVLDNGYSPKGKPAEIHLMDWFNR
ncbi:hypothetical protein HYU23_01410 [Candidatus Woesearchaeota archaeon]|nr:hypothetical protein [Candidatus Woesearchaeota archaeon]